VFDALPALVQIRCGTVLFADLRGYMNLAEKLPPAHERLQAPNGGAQYD
jgi:class 3 adenylate cyclase